MVGRLGSCRVGMGLIWFRSLAYYASLQGYHIIHALRNFHALLLHKLSRNARRELLTQERSLRKLVESQQVRILQPSFLPLLQISDFHIWKFSCILQIQFEGIEPFIEAHDAILMQNMDVLYQRPFHCIQLNKQNWGQNLNLIVLQEQTKRWSKSSQKHNLIGVQDLLFIED